MKIVNTALCSFGMSGWVFHAPFINIHPGFNLYGVWERNKNLAQAAYPQVKTYQSLETLLGDQAIELVVVNTPSYTHFDFALQALQAGKNVLVEKPFTATVSQAMELVDLAKKQNVLLTVFHNRRYDSDFKTVKKIINQGSLGEILEVEIHYDRFNPLLSPKAHKENPGPSVGVVYDLGSHLIDQALHLFGMPEYVFADISSMRPGSIVDDYFEILLLYSSLKVRLKASYFAKEAQGYIVHGRNGSFIKSRADVQEAALQAKISPNSKGWGIEPESEMGILHTDSGRNQIPTETGNYGEYYDGLYKALVEKSPSPVTAEDGLNIIKIIEAAYQSKFEKKQISI